MELVSSFHTVKLSQSLRIVSPLLPILLLIVYNLYRKHGHKTRVAKNMSPLGLSPQDPTYSARKILIFGLSLTLLAKYLQLSLLVTLIILCFTIFLSLFLPYACRIQDSAVKRRQLWRNFFI